MAKSVLACGLVILLSISCGDCLSGNVSMKNFISYPACSSDMVLGSDVLETTTTVSMLECSSRCANRDNCLAVNVCKGTNNRKVCDLLDARSNGCSGLVPRTGCKYREKDPEDHNPCLNGGTWLYANPCICPPGWAGYYCERLVRDCKEAKKSGLAMETLSLIQPVECPFSFKAYCNNWGNTYFLRRNHPFDDPGDCMGKVLDPNMDWDGYRHQFGSRNCDYIVGLEKLWHILRQGSYNLHLFLQYYANVSDKDPTTVEIYYWNFQMATEADGYAIQYTGVSPIGPEVEDGLMLGSNTPTKFCTHDQDCGTCAKDKGVAWWYTPNCDNYPLTVRNGTVVWPINGTLRLLSLAVMQFFPNSYYW